MSEQPEADQGKPANAEIGPGRHIDQPTAKVEPPAPEAVAAASDGRPGPVADGPADAHAPEVPEQAEAPAAVAHATRAPIAWRRYALQAAALVVAAGLGFLAGSHPLPGTGATATPAWAEATSSGIRQSQDQVARLAGDVRALRADLGAVKDGLDRGRADAAGLYRPMSERLERIERLAQDAATRVGRLGDLPDRIERADKETATRLAQIAERLERIERQTAAAAEPAQTGSVPKPKPAAKHALIDSYVLRDVYDGLALIEGRNGRLHEVAPGQVLPNAGRVEAIERRGRTWVVVTTRGIIGVERWQ